MLSPGHHPAHHRGVGHRHDQRHQPHRRPRRPGRRDRGHRRRARCHLRAAPRCTSGCCRPTTSGPLVAAIACGVCLGFLPHNFHPARVFMGDGGALFLGLLMAASTMVIGGRTHPVPHQRRDLLLLRPAVHSLLHPRRPHPRHGVRLRPPHGQRARASTRPDKEHIHHRLLRLGHGHRRSVLILWAWTALLSAFVLFPLFVTRPTPSSRSARPPSASASTRSSIPACAGERPGGGRALRSGHSQLPRAGGAASPRWSGFPLVIVWTRIRPEMR